MIYLLFVLAFQEKKKNRLDKKWIKIQFVQKNVCVLQKLCKCTKKETHILTIYYLFYLII